MSNPPSNPPPDDERPQPASSGEPPAPSSEPPSWEPPSSPSANPSGSAGGYPPPPGAPGYGQGSEPPPGYGQGYGPPSTGFGQGYGSGYGPPSGVAQPGDLLPRFLARLIDFVILGIVNALVARLVVAGVLGLNGAGYGYNLGISYAAGAILNVIGAAVSLGYFALMESRRGQTVGKMLLKLRTEGPDGNPPSLEVAIRRNFWVALGALAVVPIVGGLIGSLAELVIVIVIAVTIGQSPVRQGWHDGFAGGTRVIKIG